MRVYLAAPFTERAFATLIAKSLEQTANIGCTSRWLFSESDMSDTWARNDLEDIRSAHALVALNAETWANKGTGGRHVELGYALAIEKPICLVGVRTNIFHYHSAVYVIGWHDAMNLPALLVDWLESLIRPIPV
jgi:nucleoside 2-deoxyribosyltransferase